MSNRRRVMVVYKALPHYRYGVFTKLASEHQIEFTFAAGEHAEDDSIPTIPLTLFAGHHILTNHFVGPVLWQSGVIRAFLRDRPDVLICTGDASYLSTWLLAGIARMLGHTVLFWTIGWHRPERGLKRLLRLSFYRLANCLLLYGTTGQDIGRSLGYPADRMELIYNSFESSLGSERDPVSHSELIGRLPTDGICIGAVVRLNPVKQLNLIIEAASVLGSRGQDVNVLLVGEGPARDDLAQLAAKLGVRLCMPGAAYGQSDLEAVYEKLALTVVPAVAGLTVMQSLAFGTPVVSNDDRYGQAPESGAIISGETGCFYATGDVAALADSIAYWLDVLKSDPEAVAQRCRTEVTERWSSDAQATAIVDAVVRWTPDRTVSHGR